MPKYASRRYKKSDTFFEVGSISEAFNMGQFDLSVILGGLQTQTQLVVAVFIVCTVVAWIVLPYVLDRSQIRSIPGPRFARFTHFWLAYQAFLGRRSSVLHTQHLKHGKR